MAVLQNALTTDIATVDSTMDALRVTIKPDESIGAYQLTAVTGGLTLGAAGGSIFSFRYAPGTGQFCIVKRVSVAFTVTTGFTAGQQMGFGLYAARAYIASDTGGTALGPFVSNNQKYRSTMLTSGVTDARIATTATLTAGTRTLDTQPLGSTYWWNATTTVGTVLPNTNLISYNLNDYPLLLANNEGFVINNILLMGAGGVGTAVIQVEWFEAEGYRN